MANHIKTQEFTISTGESGQAEVTSSYINGCFYGFLFQSDKQVSLRLSLSEVDITLFEQRAIQGDKYLPLMARAYSDNGEVYNFAQTHWHIDDSIKIFVKGAIQSKVRIKLLYLEE